MKMPSPSVDPSLVGQQTQAAIKNQTQVQQNVSMDTANLMRTFGSPKGGLSAAASTLTGPAASPSPLAASLLAIGSGAGPSAARAQTGSSLAGLLTQPAPGTQTLVGQPLVNPVAGLFVRR